MLITACVLLVIVGGAVGAIYDVEADGSGRFATIAEAIEACVDGDKVFLGDGTYRGDGNRDLDCLGKTIVLASRSCDPTLCIIDCEGSPADPHTGIRYHLGEGRGTVLRAITISNAHAPSGTGGAAVQCIESSPTIVDCVFTGNFAETGGAVLCNSSESVFTEVQFLANSAEMGGALFCDTSDVALDHCEFADNSASGYGGAVLCHGEAQPEFEHCEFVGNQCENRGGALSVNLGWAKFTDCVFLGNRAHRGGAVYCYGHPTFESVTFSGNIADYGGVMMAMAGCPWFFSVTIADNEVLNSTSDGAAFLCVDHASPTLWRTIIAFNSGGSAIECRDTASADLYECDVFGNSHGDWVGCIEELLGVEDNICADPLFCRDANPDEPYTLHDESLCAPSSWPGPSRPQIGAWPVGCVATPVEAMSWGRIKAIYAR